jgi:hypothetical protein
LTTIVSKTRFLDANVGYFTELKTAVAIMQPTVDRSWELLPGVPKTTKRDLRKRKIPGMALQHRLGTTLDFAGVGGLAIAVGALASNYWAGAPTHELSFAVFFYALAIAVSAFALARAIQIVQLVALTPDPRLNRVETAEVFNVSPVRAVHSSESNDFQRAA